MQTWPWRTLTTATWPQACHSHRCQATGHTPLHLLWALWIGRRWRRFRRCRIRGGSSPRLSSGENGSQRSRASAGWNRFWLWLAKSRQWEAYDSTGAPPKTGGHSRQIWSFIGKFDVTGYLRSVTILGVCHGPIFLVPGPDYLYSF